MLVKKSLIISVLLLIAIGLLNACAPQQVEPIVIAQGRGSPNNFTAGSWQPSP